MWADLLRSCSVGLQWSLLCCCSFIRLYHVHKLAWVCTSAPLINTLINAPLLATLYLERHLDLDSYGQPASALTCKRDPDLSWRNLEYQSSLATGSILRDEVATDWNQTGLNRHRGHMWGPDFCLTCPLALVSTFESTSNQSLLVAKSTDPFIIALEESN